MSLPDRCSRRRRCLTYLAAAAFGVAVPAWAQTPPAERAGADAAVSAAPGSATAAGEKEDPLGPPTERGIRLTPGLAKAIAKRAAEELFVRRYELDKNKVDEAAELMARRLMAGAHATDGKAAELIEYAMLKGMEHEANRGEDSGPWPSQEFLQGLGERLLPLAPAMKDLVRGVGQDVMPLLPFKQQMKLTGDLMLAGTAMDAFEKNMQSWSRGEGNLDQNPFEAGPRADHQKDASGVTPALKQSRAAADKAVKREDTIKSVWSGYLEEAKKYYQFDAAQSATGEAVLREYMERARTMLQDPSWKQRFYRISLLQNLMWRQRMAGGSAFYNMLLQQESTAAVRAQDALGMEFRARIDEIATDAQRQQAEARIASELVARGFTASQEAR